MLTLLGSHSSAGTEAEFKWLDSASHIKSIASNENCMSAMHSTSGDCNG
jgi:hypothetical protein